jgi:hypothetical protein
LGAAAGWGLVQYSRDIPGDGSQSDTEEQHALPPKSSSEGEHTSKSAAWDPGDLGIRWLGAWERGAPVPPDLSRSSRSAALLGSMHGDRWYPLCRALEPSRCWSTQQRGGLLADCGWLSNFAPSCMIVTTALLRCLWPEFCVHSDSVVLNPTLYQNEPSRTKVQCTKMIRGVLTDG